MQSMMMFQFVSLCFARLSENCQGFDLFKQETEKSVSSSSSLAALGPSCTGLTTFINGTTAKTTWPEQEKRLKHWLVWLWLKYAHRRPRPAAPAYQRWACHRAAASLSSQTHRPRTECQKSVTERPLCWWGMRWRAWHDRGLNQVHSGFGRKCGRPRSLARLTPPRPRSANERPNDNISGKPGARPSIVQCLWWLETRIQLPLLKPVLTCHWFTSQSVKSMHSTDDNCYLLNIDGKILQSVNQYLL